MALLEKQNFLIIAALSLVTLFSACKKNDDDVDDSDAFVKTPAWPVLDKENSLAIFFLPAFNYVENQQPENDNFTVYFEAFKPVSNIEPEEDDIDQTSNDLLFEETVWDDRQTQWLTNSNILSSAQSPFQKPRSYRILDGGILDGEVTGKNLPIYEAIDDNIFTRHLATEYIWDIGDLTDAEDEDLSNEEIKDYETSKGGYSLLPHASIWSDIDGIDYTFSEGALLYSAIYSVNNNVYVVESVDDGSGNFSLSAASISVSSATTLSDLVLEYQEPTRLEYKFTTGFLNNQSIFIGFDSGTQTARLATTSTGAAEATVNYTVEDALLYIEIDTQALDKATLEALKLEPFFNPIIVGASSTGFYAGKHYITTTKDTREHLNPVFLFNSTAQNDIQNTFKAWRDDKYQNPP